MGTEEVVTAAIISGVSDFILKPVDPVMLHEKIAKWI
jgi:response regulator RpfG family c-di-GMP phosphodiesterase